MQNYLVNLTFTDYNGVNVVDSRDVAKMMGREHKEIVRGFSPYVLHALSLQRFQTLQV
jgi:phage regulator Rha-like protein